MKGKALKFSGFLTFFLLIITDTVTGVDHNNLLNNKYRNSSYEWLSYSVIVITLLLIILVIVSYMLYISKRRNKILKHKNLELKRINNQLDKFIYSASHDLKSPLNSISGLIDIARKEQDPTQVYNYLEMINKSVDKLKELINDIVNLARNRSGKAEKSKIDLNAFFKELIDEYRYQQEASDVNIKLHINQAKKFYSDKSRLYIIFSNLLSNSIRYKDPDKTKKQVEIEAEVDDQQATIKVWDNGIGMNKEEKEKIFNMFYRVKTDKQGSGLGLYILKNTIYQMGGHVRVDAKKGAYTQFIITLPNLYN